METREQFYNDIKKLFPFHKKAERKYLSNLKAQIEECDCFTYDELEDVFGRPQDIVESYYESSGHSYSSKKGNPFRYLIITCIIVCVSVVSLFIWKKHLDFKTYEIINNQEIQTIIAKQPDTTITNEEINGEPQLR